MNAITHKELGDMMITRQYQHEKWVRKLVKRLQLSP
jgi:hypothetical protein